MMLKKMMGLVFVLVLGALWLIIRSQWVDFRIFGHPSGRVSKTKETTVSGGSAGCGQNPSYPCAYSDES